MSHRTVAALMALFLAVSVSLAHPGHGESGDLRLFKDAEGLFEIEASFSLEKDGKALLVKHDGEVVWTPIACLSAADREWIRARKAAIARMNGDSAAIVPTSDGQSITGMVVLGMTGLVVLALAGNATRKRWSVAPFAGSAAVLLMAGAWAVAAWVRDTPPAIQGHFEPFKDNLKFRSDDDWFYVESNGMPDHPMMVGISAWQQ